MFKYSISFPAAYDGYGWNKVAVIKAMREITGMGLKEAKDIIESPASFIYRSQFDMPSVSRRTLELNGCSVREVDATDLPAASTVKDLLLAAARSTLNDGDVAKTIAILRLI